MGGEIFFRLAPLHAPIGGEAEDSFVVIEIAVVEKAHPFIDKFAVLLEPCQRRHGDYRDKLIAVGSRIKCLKLAPCFALVAGDGAVEAAGGVHSGPLGVGGNENQFVGRAVRKFEAVDSRCLERFFPRLGRRGYIFCVAAPAVRAYFIENGTLAVAVGIYSKNIAVFEQDGVGVAKIAFAVVDHGLFVEISVFFRCILRLHAQIELRDGIIFADKIIHSFTPLSLLF